MSRHVESFYLFSPLLLGFMLALVDLLDDVDSSGTQLIVLEAKGISLFFRSVFFSPVKRIISNSSEVLCNSFRISATGHVSSECGWKIVSEV